MAHHDKKGAVEVALDDLAGRNTSTTTTVRTNSERKEETIVSKTEASDNEKERK
jgi:hypothetical protein